MGAYTEIVDFTFTANETSRAFTGLNITKDDFIKIVLTFTNASGSGANLLITANSSINSNYHSQTLVGFGSSVSASRANDARIGEATGNKTSVSTAFLKLSENDRLNSFSNYNRENDTDIQNGFQYTTSSGATFTSGITSLTFTSTQTNGIGTGSRIQIYRLDAEKVADITTTANATQVDISSLSIGKDSEYLLVSDIVNPQTFGTAINLTVNDATTLTNYYRQALDGDGTFAGASRTNNAQAMFVRNTAGQNRSMAYSHIKLSEIGAYTSQTYFTYSYGSNNSGLQNNFISSTSEAITSITKLNVIASDANTIGSGSRFILYKLK